MFVWTPRLLYTTSVWHILVWVSTYVYMLIFWMHVDVIPISSIQFELLGFA